MHKLTLATLMALTTTLSHSQTCNPKVVREAPDSRYQSLNSGAEVKDTQTGLIWKRCSLGQTWSGTSCIGTAVTYNWPNALQAAKNIGSGWRVPNVKELSSLIEEACYNTATNETYFSNTVRSDYWSSSSYAYNSNSAWIVNFIIGLSQNDYKNDKNYVRLVRSGQ